MTTATPPAQPLAVQERQSRSTNLAIDLMDSTRFEHMYRIATALARSNLTPKHLVGATPEATAANCFRVVNQAIRWQFDPFAVADESYVVSGKLGYQGKLVAAVINCRAGIKGRIRARYRGKIPDLAATIYATFEGEDEESTIEIEWAKARTKNDFWDKEPEQKLFYSGVVKWARRHCPEVIMGVLTDDDLEQIAIAHAASAAPAPVGRVSFRNGRKEEPVVMQAEESPSESRASAPVNEFASSPETGARAPSATDAVDQYSHDASEGKSDALPTAQQDAESLQREDLAKEIGDRIADAGMAHMAQIRSDIDKEREFLGDTLHSHLTELARKRESQLAAKSVKRKGY
jgi:hypothetical protein